MCCESISKIFDFSFTAEKKELCEATRLSFLGLSIMCDCKQMQARKKNGKYINLIEAKKQVKCCKIG